AAGRRLRADPARQHVRRDDDRGGAPHRWPGRARGLGWPHPRARPPGRADRRRLHLRRGAHPLGQGLRPGHGPAGRLTMALLSVAISNANTQLGLVSDGQVGPNWLVSTDERRTADEWAALIRGLLGADGADRVDGVSVCATVPAVLHEWRDMFARHFAG